MCRNVRRFPAKTQRLLMEEWIARALVTPGFREEAERNYKWWWEVRAMDLERMKRELATAVVDAVAIEMETDEQLPRRTWGGTSRRPKDRRT